MQEANLANPTVNSHAANQKPLMLISCVMGQFLVLGFLPSCFLASTQQDEAQAMARLGDCIRTLCDAVTVRELLKRRTQKLN
jgi:hypothetical protein